MSKQLKEMALPEGSAITLLRNVENHEVADRKGASLSCVSTPRPRPPGTQMSQEEVLAELEKVSSRHDSSILEGQNEVTFTLRSPRSQPSTPLTPRPEFDPTKPFGEINASERYYTPKFNMDDLDLFRPAEEDEVDDNDPRIQKLLKEKARIQQEILDVTDPDVLKAQKDAYKYWNEMKEKSPRMTKLEAKSQHIDIAPLTFVDETTSIDEVPGKLVIVHHSAKEEFAPAIFPNLVTEKADVDEISEVGSAKSAPSHQSGSQDQDHSQISDTPYQDFDDQVKQDIEELLVPLFPNFVDWMKANLVDRNGELHLPDVNYPAYLDLMKHLQQLSLSELRTLFNLIVSNDVPPEGKLAHMVQEVYARKEGSKDNDSVSSKSDRKPSVNVHQSQTSKKEVTILSLAAEWAKKFQSDAKTLVILDFLQKHLDDTTLSSLLAAFPDSGGESERYCYLRFVNVDVGTNGRVSDAGIWNKCTLKKYLEQLKIPPAPLPDTCNLFPYVVVGDEGFPLSQQVLIQFPKDLLRKRNDRRIFNYRLSRARRCSENAFGLLVARFQIFRSSMRYDPGVARKIILSTLCLHNWLRTDVVGRSMYSPPGSIDSEDVVMSAVQFGEWRNDAAGACGVERLAHRGGNRHAAGPIELRNRWCDYFNNEGAVPWQERMISVNNIN